MEQVRVARKYRRFLTHGRVLARVRSTPETMFHVIDISVGGLAFRYLGDGELGGSADEIDLFHDESLALRGIPVRAVSDCPLDYGFIPMRRRSLSFGDLTPEQRFALDAFIVNYTEAGRS
jgi:hypothetical protein